MILEDTLRFSPRELQDHFSCVTENEQFGEISAEHFLRFRIGEIPIGMGSFTLPAEEDELHFIEFYPRQAFAQVTGSVVEQAGRSRRLPRGIGTLAMLALVNHAEESGVQDYCIVRPFTDQSDDLQAYLSAIGLGSETFYFGEMRQEVEVFAEKLGFHGPAGI